MIVVTGATGNIGRNVVEKLLEQGEKVRAVARGREKLEALGARGAEISAGTLEDPAFLAKAFSGADSVLAMIPTNVQAQNAAKYQDQVGESIVRALREAGVKHVVDISSMGGHTEDGTGIVAGLARQEKRLDALPGVNVLHLRPGYFMENFLGSIAMVKGMGILGSSIQPEVKLHLIAAADIARYAAERLRKRDFTGKSAQELIGSRDATMREVAAALGKAIGKPDLSYVQFPHEEAAKAMVGMGFSPSIAENFVALNRAFNEKTVMKTKARDAKNTTPTTLEEFAKTFAAAYKS